MTSTIDVSRSGMCRKRKNPPNRGTDFTLTDKAPKKNPIASWFKKISHTKSKKAKRDKYQGPSLAQNGSANPSPAQKSEIVPIVNGAGCDETDPMQRVPSNGGDDDTTAVPPPQTSDSADAYRLPAPETSSSFTSLPHTNGEILERGSGDHGVDASNKSAAPTLATTPDLSNNEADQSKSGTTLAGGGGMSSHSGGGSNSIFSSSNHSSRSLTTTLTTIQSTAPSAHLQHAGVPTGALTGHQAAAGAAHGHQHHPSHSSSVYFQHQYPTTPTASTVPTYLQTPSSIYTASHLPTTYRSATANNLLTDNASILTLASSSQQAGRRNSLDTAASVRAIAPSSQWGGSRESLPLSTLSQPIDGPGMSGAGGLGHNIASQRPSIGGHPATERGSIYSNQGVTAPLLSSERNSIYTGRTGTAGGASTHNTVSDNASLRERATGDERNSLRESTFRGLPGGDERNSVKADDRSSVKAGDGASIRSGYTGLGGMGHGRNDSIAGSIGATAAGANSSASALNAPGGNSPVMTSPSSDQG